MRKSLKLKDRIALELMWAREDFKQLKTIQRFFFNGLFTFFNL